MPSPSTSRAPAITENVVYLEAGLQSTTNLNDGPQNTPSLLRVGREKKISSPDKQSQPRSPAQANSYRKTNNSTRLESVPEAVEEATIRAVVEVVTPIVIMIVIMM